MHREVKLWKFRLESAHRYATVQFAFILSICKWVCRDSYIKNHHPRTSSIELVRVMPKGAGLTIAVFSLFLKPLSSELNKSPFECRLGSLRFILDTIPLMMQSLASVSASSTFSDERYVFTSVFDTSGCFC